MQPLYTTLHTQERSGMGFTFMEAFSDEITVKSEPGKGTTVKLIKIMGKGEECGSLCTLNDVLCNEITLRGLEKGSILVFERTGAYSAMEGMALFLSHELPGVVLYSEEEGWIQARVQQETYELNMVEQLS